MKLSLWQLALPIPHKAVPIRLANNHEIYEIDMSQQYHTFHPDAQDVPVWCYMDKNPHGKNVPQTYLGPIIEAMQGIPVGIRWINRLPVNKKLPFNTQMPQKTAANGDHNHSDPKPGNVVVHLHGAHCPPASDGYPEEFLHPYNPADPEQGDSMKDCLYPNHQRGTTLWYHDHAMGIARFNVYAGLAGMYILRDSAESALGLPTGDFEVPLIIQDRRFTSMCGITQMHYEVSAEQPKFFGDHAVVNGAVWPYFNAEQRRYRFRMVNGSNSRFYRLRFKSISEHGGSFPVAYQIGTDGGFLPVPVPVLTTTPLILAPGERADVIIDFSGCTITDEFLLENDAPAPFSVAECLPSDDSMRNIIKFVIQPINGTDSSAKAETLKLPCNFNVDIKGIKVPLNKVSAVRAALSQTGLPRIKTRKMTLVKTTKMVDGNEVPGQVLLNNFQFNDPATETPQLNDIELWEINNTTGDVHPVHLHLVQFLVLDRAGVAANVDGNEAGWKDTVRCNPNETTRIIMRFTGYTGKFVWHCHMLEHGDQDTMRPLIVG
jgi:spore coat protein A